LFVNAKENISGAFLLFNIKSVNGMEPDPLMVIKFLNAFDEYGGNPKVNIAFLIRRPFNISELVRIRLPRV
jgi:hypothetical protein